jgi:urease accessory protein UreH
MDTIYNISELTDDDLKQLMSKYKEKQERYDLMMNEATERNNKIIIRIYNEQVKRLINKHVEMFKKARMEASKEAM